MKDCYNFSTTEIIENLSLIMAMSTKHFEFTYLKMGLIFNYTTDLKSISHSFLERALPCIGLSTPDQKVSRDFYDPQTFLKLWREFLDKAAALNLTDIICAWILQLQKQKSLPFTSSMIDWDSVFKVWIFDNSQLTLPQIPEIKLKDITILFLKRQLNLIDLDIRWHRSHIRFEIEMDEWEEYIMQTQGCHTWMQVHLRNVEDISFWLAVFALLDEVEIQALSIWMENEVENLPYADVRKKYALDHTTITEFADRLKILGYLET